MIYCLGQKGIIEMNEKDLEINKINEALIDLIIEI